METSPRRDNLRETSAPCSRHFLLISAGLVASVAAPLLLRDESGARRSAADQAKAASDATNWQEADDLAVSHDEMRVETDQVVLRNDGLRLDIARLEGKQAADASLKVAKDREILVADQFVVQLDRQKKTFGPSNNVRKAVEREQAASNAEVAYQDGARRQQHLLWAALAVGFFGLVCLVGWRSA